MKDMNMLEIDSISSLARIMFNNAKSGRNTDCVCFYDEANELMLELIKKYDAKPELLEIGTYDFTDYDLEYSVAYNADGTLLIEKLYHEDNKYHKAGYLGYESDITYMLKDISPECAEKCSSELIYDVDFVDEDDKCDCEKCCKCKHVKRYDAIDALIELLEIL